MLDFALTLSGSRDEGLTSLLCCFGGGGVVGTCAFLAKEFRSWVRTPDSLLTHALPCPVYVKSWWWQRALSLALPAVPPGCLSLLCWVHRPLVKQWRRPEAGRLHPKAAADVENR